MQLPIRAKSQFSTRDFSDHLTYVRAFNSWKYAEKQQFGDEYCQRNFLSIQTLKDMDSLRNQFLLLLKDTGLVDFNSDINNRCSHDEFIIRAIICAGLFPGICSVMVSFYSNSYLPFYTTMIHDWRLSLNFNLQNKEKNCVFKTVEDGMVSLCSVSYHNS